MLSRSSVRAPKYQQGIALLILIIVIVLAFATYSFSGLSINQVKTDNKVQTRIALKKAKSALLAYAASFPEITPSDRGPGYLPCPDLLNNGISSANNCKTAGVPNVGRLPWVTIGSGELRDGVNERLWYAVSENFDYSNSPTQYKINTATLGTMTLKDSNNAVIYDGTSLDAVVAVVISPGEALIRDDGVVQNRSLATENNPVNYLDVHVTSAEDNASFLHGTLDGFIAGDIRNGAGNVIVNDQFAVITYGDIMRQVHKRVSREIAKAINAYAALCGSYPEASAFNSTKANGLYISDVGVIKGNLPVDSPEWGPPTLPNPSPCADGMLPIWVENEEWHKVTYYEYAASIPCDVATDCLDVSPSNNVNALIIFAGRDITGGNRHSALLTDYFESENSNGDLVYDAAEAEDYVWVIAP